MTFSMPALDDALNQLQMSATAENPWDGVLDKICKATGSVSGVVVPIRSRTPGLVSTENMQPVLDTYFQDEWHLRDFRMRGIPHLMRKGSMIEQDYATEEDFRNEGYYKFLAKYNLRWTAMVGFESAPGDMSCFVLYRRLTDDAYSREEEAILRRMRGQLTTLSQISHEISRARIHGMANAFEILGSAAIFFDRFCRVSALNAPAERLIGNGLQVSRRELHSWLRADTDALYQRLKAVIGIHSLLTGKGDPILLSRANKKPLIVRVQRLTGDLADIFSHSVAVALISDPEVRPATSGSLLTKTFGLTKTEVSIALDLAAGDSPREIDPRR